jgi:hypothetical protein
MPGIGYFYAHTTNRINSYFGRIGALRPVLHS